jgi:uncharacterized protein
MKISNSVKITGLIVVAAIVIALIGFSAFDRVMPGNTLSVSGISEVIVIPDLVGLYFSVQTNGSTAKEAKDANSMIADELIVALLGEGFSRDEIETIQFSVNEQYDWSQDGRKFIGYQATHRIRVRVSTEEKSKIGSAIDVGVDSGASLNYINYELSRESENQYKAEALKLATEDARIKAEAMADGLGARLGRIYSTSDSNFDYYPVLYAEMEGSSVDSREIATNIQPSEQKVIGRVSVVYKLK